MFGKERMRHEEKKGNESYRALEEFVQSSVDRKYRRRTHFEYVIIVFSLILLGILGYLAACNRDAIYQYLTQFEATETIAAIIGAFLLIGMVFDTSRRILRLAKVMFWTRVDGKLLTKKIENVTGFGYSLFRPKFTYEYVINDRTYIGEGYTPNKDIMLFRFVAGFVLDCFGEGRQYKVYCNPQDNSESYFVNLSGFLHLLTRLLMIIAIACVVLMPFL